MFVDSHCHLNYPEFQPHMAQIREEMQKARVDRALIISTKLETFDAVQGLAQSYDNFWCTLGVHPDEDQVQEPSMEDLRARVNRGKVVGIGETGLDYYRLEGRSIEDMHWQRERFRTHIRFAQECRLPLIIHTREASKDTLEILKQEGESGQGRSVGGVFHCFTESMEVAKAALDLGFYISFSGIVTFKNAKEIKEVAKWVPLERMLIETDSPYLAPSPHRGKTNNPSYVPFVAQEIALLKGVSIEDVAHQTSQNFEDLFQHARAAPAQQNCT
jgi:TatD DNase family protein